MVSYDIKWCFLLFLYKTPLLRTCKIPIFTFFSIPLFYDTYIKQSLCHSWGWQPNTGSIAVPWRHRFKVHKSLYFLGFFFCNLFYRNSPAELSLLLSISLDVLLQSLFWAFPWILSWWRTNWWDNMVLWQLQQL